MEHIPLTLSIDWLEQQSGNPQLCIVDATKFIKLSRNDRLLNKRPRCLRKGGTVFGCLFCSYSYFDMLEAGDVEQAAIGQL